MIVCYQYVCERTTLFYRYGELASKKPYTNEPIYAEGNVIHLGFGIFAYPICAWKIKSNK